MATRSVPPLDHDDVGVAVLDQRVDERHAERPGANDEIVGLDESSAIRARYSRVLMQHGGLELRVAVYDAG